MKQICLIRHAKPLDAHFPDDHSRTLSEEGKKTTEAITLELQKRGVNPTLILSSPKLRALETANIMGHHYQVPVVEEELLSGHYSPYLIFPLLQNVEEGETLFVVTHMPIIVELSNMLGEGESVHSFPQSSAVLFAFSDAVQRGEGKLQFHLIP